MPLTILDSKGRTRAGVCTPFLLRAAKKGGMVQDARAVVLLIHVETGDARASGAALHKRGAGLRATPRGVPSSNRNRVE